jgi:glycogen synthase
MKIIHFTSEFAPVIWGGLGLAVSGLAVAQAMLGHDVAVIMPYCDNIRINGRAPEIVASLTVDRIFGDADVTDGTMHFLVMRIFANGLSVYFVHHPTLNGRSIYAYSNSESNIHVFMASAAVAVADRVIFPEGFDVFNCHDWTTAFACYLLKEDKNHVQSTVCVLTVHNFFSQRHSCGRRRPENGFTLAAFR